MILTRCETHLMVMTELNGVVQTKVASLAIFTMNNKRFKVTNDGLHCKSILDTATKHLILTFCK